MPEDLHQHVVKTEKFPDEIEEGIYRLSVESLVNNSGRGGP
jgi:hypothetical protein